MDSGEQFGMPFEGNVQKTFGNEADLGNLSREHVNTDPTGGGGTSIFATVHSPTPHPSGIK